MESESDTLWILEMTDPKSPFPFGSLDCEIVG